MPLSETMNTALVGLQYGDEGKGQLVNLLSSDFNVVVRYNGGANAGHSVAVDDESFALHQLPVGVLTPSCLGVLANGVVLDVERLMEEVSPLSARGIRVGDNLRISDRAHIVMPYHFEEERLRDTLAQQLLGDKGRLGTTFRGIGTCYADKMARDSAVRVADLFQPATLKKRLGFIVELKEATLSALARRVGMHHHSLSLEELSGKCGHWAEQIHPFVCDSGALLHEAVAQGHRILFEGANAAHLDIDHGNYPFVTSSNSSTLGISAGTGLSTSTIGETIGVAKLYMSRVGTGPFPTEIHGEQAEELRQRGGEYGTTTKRPRRVGWLDLPALRSTVRQNGVTRLALTGLGVLAGMPHIKVCTAYRLRGREVSYVPASAADLDEVEPVYRDMEGFIGPLDRYNSIEELPTAVQAIIRLVEAETAPVSYVCIGRRRDQVLRRRS